MLLCPDVIVSGHYVDDVTWMTVPTQPASSVRVTSDPLSLLSFPASSPRFQTPTTCETLSATPRPATSVCTAP